jgi:uncharacterized protein YbjT (DUF2867 family)
MIVVIGGTGNTGRALVSALTAKGLDFKCLVRDIDKARETLGADVALVSGDLDDPASLDAAFAGADKVFLNSGHGPALQQQQMNAVDAAKRARVSHFVKMSGSEKGITADSPSQILRDHYHVEEALKASGLAWTIVQPNYFLNNVMMFAPTVASDSKFMSPIKADAPISMIDVRDTADCVVAVLTEPGHEGKTYYLTGAIITLNDVAAEFTRVLGREISLVTVPLEGAQAAMKNQGMPDWLIAHMSALVPFVSDGGMGGLSDWVEKLSGHPPRTLAGIIEENKAAFGG